MVCPTTGRLEDLGFCFKMLSWWYFEFSSHVSQVTFSSFGCTSQDVLVCYKAAQNTVKMSWFATRLHSALSRCPGLPQGCTKQCQTTWFTTRLHRTMTICPGLPIAGRPPLWSVKHGTKSPSSHFSRNKCEGATGSQYTSCDTWQCLST